MSNYQILEKNPHHSPQDNLTLTQALEDQKKQNITLRNENSQLRTENNQLRTELQMSIEKIKDLNTENLQLKSDLALYKKENLELRQELKLSKEKIISLENIIKNYQNAPIIRSPVIRQNPQNCNSLIDINNEQSSHIYHQEQEIKRLKATIMQQKKLPQEQAVVLITTSIIVTALAQKSGINLFKTNGEMPIQGQEISPLAPIPVAAA